MIGRTLSHYRIVGQLGSGGMGVVYSAEDDRLGRQVALKFVSSDFAHDEQAIQRLRSEARAASALNHPNICTIYDIGEDEGHPFIVMELMKGQSLRDRLNAGALKITQLVDIGIEVADALHTAHSVGIIHRDIKPGNIFITERGHVKILDFGLAKLTSNLASSTTTDPSPHTSATGVTHGTPAYMSPEQATGETLDGRTDLFSLGVVLYESATGHHPFPGKTSAVVLAGILDRSPASPLSHNPDLPVRLGEIISNCLEKDRELRYQSAADLRADLRRLRRDLDSGAVRPIDRSGLEQTAPMATAPGSGPATRSSHRVEPVVEAATIETPVRGKTNLGTAWAAVAVVLGVVAAIGFALWPRSGPPSSSQVAPPSAVEIPPPVPRPSTEAQMTAATASFSAGNYRAALASAREVLALDPANAAAAKIRDDATAMLARFDEEIADARRRLDGGDLEGAVRALERARAIDLSSPTIVELSARVAEAARTRNSGDRPGPRTLPPAPSRTLPPPPVQAAPVAAAPSTPPSVPAPPPVAELPPSTPPPDPQVVAPAKPTDPSPRPTAPPVASKEPAKEPVAPPSAVDRTVTSPAPVLKDADESAIRQVILAYGRAIETKDIALFRSVKPNLTPQDERRLQDGFRAVTSQRVSLSVISIDQKGDHATAVVRRRDDIEAVGRKQTTDARQVLTFSRVASGWVITEIR